MASQNVLVEAFYGGGWQDITSRAYIRDGIKITRGSADEDEAAPPCTCTLTLDNRDGWANPRNPSSALYGKAGRNTPLRVSCSTDPVLDDDFTRSVTDQWTGGSFPWALSGGTVPDDYDINGTKGLQTHPSANVLHYCTTDTGQTDGRFRTTFNLSAGTITGASASVWVLGRFTDTSNYYAALVSCTTSGSVTIGIYKRVAGSLTLLSSLVTTHVGYGGFFALRQFSVELYVERDRLYAKIWDTIDAEPSAWNVTAVDTSLTAGTLAGVASRRETGNTNANLAVAFDSFLAVPGPTRLTGEISSWRPRRAIRGDAWTEITASGITRRLGQGADVLVSPLRRAYGSNVPTAYWPLEDDAQSAAASSAMPGGRAATADGVEFGPDDTLPAAAGVATFSSTSSLSGTVVPYTGTGSALSMVFLFKLPSMPAAAVLLAQWRTTGTVKRWELSVDAVGYYLDGYPADPTAAAIYHRATGFGAGAEPTNWIAMHVGLLNNGANVDVSWLWTAVGSSTFYSSSTTSSFAGVCGRAQAFLIPASTGLDGAKFTHAMLTAAPLPFVTSTFDRAASAYDGEAAGTRFLRLCAEEGIPASVVGTSTDTQVMGPQRLDALTNLLAEVERTDDGMLLEPRTSRGLVFRTGRSRYNQTAALVLDYTTKGQVAPPLDPDIDDLGTRNDVTAKRPLGGTARAVRESGPLNVQDPTDDPDGVGRVTTQVDPNTVNDAALVHHAYWHLNKGTVADTRYPQVTVDLVASPALAASAAAVDVGDRITITNIPDQPDPAELIVLGYTETIGSHTRTITFNCSPETPFRIGTYDGTTSRYESAGSTLAALQAAITDSFTRTVASGWGSATSGQAWTTSGGVAGDYAVNGSAGTHSVGAVGSSRRTLIGSAVAEADVTVTVATSALAVGASQQPSIMVRHADLDNLYMLQARLNTDQSVTARIVARVAGVETELAAATVAGLTHQAGVGIRIRGQVAGTTVRVKVWAGTEPDAWTATATSSAITAAGQVGLRSILAAGNTNSLPVTFTYDDLSAPTDDILAESTSLSIATASGPLWTTRVGAFPFDLLVEGERVTVTNITGAASPQTFTVVRSVNGVVKAHSVGAPVRLFRQVRYGL